MAIYNKLVKASTQNQLIDHHMRRNSIINYIYGIIRFLGIIVENLYCISSYLVLSWIIFLPISWFKSELYSRAENYLYNSLLFIVSSWSLAAGATVVETGDDYKQLIENPQNQSLETDNEIRRESKQFNSIKLQRRHRTTIENHEDRNQPPIKQNGFTKHFNHLDVIENNTTTVAKSGSITTQTSMLTNGTNGLTKLRNGFSDYRDKLIDLCADNGQKKLILNYASEVDILRNNNNNVEDPRNILHTSKKLDEVPNYKIGSSNGSLCKNKNSLISFSGDGSFMKSNQTRPRILLLCNHISTADVPLIMQSFSTLTNQSILWVLDAQFKPTNFGIVCGSHGDFFVAKNSYSEGSLRDQVLKYPDRNVLVLFPEGGFLRKRLEGSNRYATKNGLPLTKYVSHPRFGAFKDLIDPCVGVTHIVDATLLYNDLEDPLSIIDIALGTRKEPAILNFKVYKRSEIDPTEEWLRKIWLDKDKFMKRFYEDRASVIKQIQNTMRVAQLDWFKLLAVHLFYLSFCYLVIVRLFCATNVTMLRAKELYYSNI